MSDLNKIDWKKVDLNGLIKCDVCGRQFGSKREKNRHMDIHIFEAKKRGLVPKYSYNPKTDEEIFLGFESAFDIY